MITPAGIPLDCRGSGPRGILSLTLPSAFLMDRLQKLTDGDEVDLAVLFSRMHRDPVIESLMSCLSDARSKRAMHQDMLTDSLLNALVVRLFQLSQTSLEPVPVPRKALSSHAFARVLELMHARLSEPLRLEDLATAAGCSQLYFSRMFKTHTGQSPHTYLIGLRVERAQRLMFDHPEWTLAAVALACGFSDQSHLNRHFKRIVGVTPGQYRGEAGR